MIAFSLRYFSLFTFGLHLINAQKEAKATTGHSLTDEHDIHGEETVSAGGHGGGAVHAALATPHHGRGGPTDAGMEMNKIHEGAANVLGRNGSLDASGTAKAENNGGHNRATGGKTIFCGKYLFLIGLSLLLRFSMLKYQNI